MTPDTTERNPQGDNGLAGPLATPEFDVGTPNVARIYDYMIGGKDSFAADRAAAEQVLEQLPFAAGACQQNRAFLGRVVTSLAEQGIRQFLDIGSGLPTQRNVHEIAQAAAPGSRVVYVDYDPLVLAHARALLTSNDQGSVAYVEADLRDPEKIISGAGGLLDFSQPVALLLFAILHFVRDDEQPQLIVRTLTEVLAPRSALAISHITGEETEPEKGRAAQQVYQGASAPAVPRSRQEITRFFDGLTLTKPGVVDIADWPQRITGPGTPLSFYGGVATKPGRTA